MRATPRPLLSYASFVALLVVDVVALVSLLLVQALGAPMPVAWIVAAVLAAMASPALLKVADKVFAWARNGATIPSAGGSFL